MHLEIEKILSGGGGWGWGPDVFLVINIFHKGVSVPVFLRKPITTCDFSGAG